MRLVEEAPFKTADLDECQRITASGEEVRDSVRERFLDGHLEGGDGWIDRARGCLIGGAIGDALGAPIEFMSRAEILASFGAHGLRDLVPAYGKVGAITDDTQMTLFTREGLLRASMDGRVGGINPDYAAAIDHAYARWLITQGEVPGFKPASTAAATGWLMTHQELFTRRAPGATCVSAIRAKTQAGKPAINASKGCGGVMRVAPVGIYCASENAFTSEEQRDRITFERGCQTAGLTHGHPTGQAPAGYLSVLIALIASGQPWTEATARAFAQLSRMHGHEETFTAIKQAIRAASAEPWSSSRLAELGEGWVAEEALAISIYRAASAFRSNNVGPEKVRRALLLSVNHGGDSDSTARSPATSLVPPWVSHAYRRRGEPRSNSAPHLVKWARTS